MKNLQKGFVVPLVITIAALLIVGSGGYYYARKMGIIPDNTPSDIIQPNNPNTDNLIGGDTDIHGCLGPAGYSWCAVKNKCLRVWEEKCEGTPINSGPGDKDGYVACTMDAMQCPDGSYVGRSGPKCEFVCPVANIILTVLSPNGNEKIRYSDIYMAGDLYFNWTTSEKEKYTPTEKFNAYIVDLNGVVLRDDPVLPKYSLALSPGVGIYRTTFVGHKNLEANRNYKIKVCDYIMGKEYCDLSDNYFTITP